MHVAGNGKKQFLSEVSGLKKVYKGLAMSHNGISPPPPFFSL